MPQKDKHSFLWQWENYCDFPSHAARRRNQEGTEKPPANVCFLMNILEKKINFIHPSPSPFCHATSTEGQNTPWKFRKFGFLFASLSAGFALRLVAQRLHKSWVAFSNQCESCEWIWPPWKVNIVHQLFTKLTPMKTSHLVLQIQLQCPGHCEEYCSIVLVRL